MGNPLKNLGDYDEVRRDLQEAGGSKDALYQAIKDAGSAEAAPGQIALGAAITAGIIAIGVGVYKVVDGFMKKRKQAIANEPALKKEFADTLETKLLEENNGEG